VVPDRDVVPIDCTVGDPAVAALGLSAVAAWMVLSWRANLQAGETVVVLGASGAVGQAAIGAARALGAGRVVAVCRSARGAARATTAGADHVVQMPSAPDADALAASLRAACDGAADVVVDPVFGYSAAAACTVLGSGGRLVNLGSTGGDQATLSSSVLRSRSISVLGYTNNSLLPAQRAAALTAVLREAEFGRIAVEHEVLPLSDCAAGWRSTAAGSGRRIVLVP
jgi:NADPH:quinone reductase-like Zn-dependent oxidoreductase